MVVRATRQDFMGYLPCSGCDSSFPGEQLHPVVSIESAVVDGDLDQNTRVEVAKNIYSAILNHWSKKVL